MLFQRLPFGSNLDEFHLLSHATNVRWVTDAGSIDHLDPIRDMVVLPGSKHVVADMEWMRSHGLDDAVRFAAGRGVRIIGVCGGAMRRPPMWHTGNVLASMLHGLFEAPELLRRLFGVHVTPVLDDTFDLLADAVEQHLDTGLLRRLVGT